MHMGLATAYHFLPSFSVTLLPTPAHAIFFRRYSISHFVAITASVIGLLAAIRSLRALLLVSIGGAEGIFTAVLCSTVDKVLLPRKAQHNTVPYSSALPVGQLFCLHSIFFCLNLPRKTY